MYFRDAEAATELSVSSPAAVAVDSFPANVRPEREARAGELDLVKVGQVAELPEMREARCERVS